MKTKGLNTHPIFKLGKGPARKDQRDLKMAVILKKIALPDKYDFDAQYNDIPLPMFLNDTYGDCVIAARAHQCLRFERKEQGIILPITDAIVKREYFRETGGADDGLVIGDSLDLWRKKGWKIGRHVYKIDAYAAINYKNRDEIKRSIISNVGVQFGLNLPLLASDQFGAGLPWTVGAGRNARPGSWGGHDALAVAYFDVAGFNADGPILVTWAQKQQATWDFIDYYADECFGILDRLNRFRKSINVAAVKEFLGGVAKAA